MVESLHLFIPLLLGAFSLYLTSNKAKKARERIKSKEDLGLLKYYERIEQFSLFPLVLFEIYLVLIIGLASEEKLYINFELLMQQITWAIVFYIGYIILDIIGLLYFWKFEAKESKEFLYSGFTRINSSIAKSN